MFMKMTMIFFYVLVIVVLISSSPGYSGSQRSCGFTPTVADSRINGPDPGSIKAAVSQN